MRVGYTKNPDILLLSSNIIGKATTKILSAIGSEIFQFDSISNFQVQCSHLKSLKNKQIHKMTVQPSYIWVGPIQYK